MKTNKNQICFKPDPKLWIVFDCNGMKLRLIRIVATHFNYSDTPAVSLANAIITNN